MNGATTDESFVHKYATAATIGLFAITGITGLLLFFHLGVSFFKGIHEWLGVLFVVASIFHVVRNSGAFMRLMARPSTLVICGIVLVVSAMMLMGAGDRTRNSSFHGRHGALDLPSQTEPALSPTSRFPGMIQSVTREA